MIDYELAIHGAIMAAVWAWSMLSAGRGAATIVITISWIMISTAVSWVMREESVFILLMLYGAIVNSSLLVILGNNFINKCKKGVRK